jgi:hypothetical protein
MFTIADTSRKLTAEPIVAGTVPPGAALTLYGLSELLLGLPSLGTGHCHVSSPESQRTAETRTRCTALNRMDNRATVDKLTNMEVHLKPELQERVDRAAKENNSGPAEYVQQLVEHYVDHAYGSGSKSRKGWTNLTAAST